MFRFLLVPAQRAVRAGRRLSFACALHATEKPVTQDLLPHPQFYYTNILAAQPLPLAFLETSLAISTIVLRSPDRPPHRSTHRSPAAQS
jgi:hypothetical protein